MATVTAASIATSDSLERFRQEFNTLRSDVSNITSGTITINNESNNRILTSVSENTFNAEESLTFDGSTFAVGGAMTVTGLTTLSGNLIIPNAGNIGSAGDTDAIAIASDGVVTMNQIPVFSAGINVSGGSIAGTLSTAALGKFTSLGTLTGLTVSGDVTFTGDSNNVVWDKSDNALEFADNAKAFFGTSSDGLEIYHDGSDSHIKDSGTGDLYISASDDIVIRTKAGAETAMIINDDGAVELYHDNNLRLATDTVGVKVTGNMVPASADGGRLGQTDLEWADLYLADSSTIQFGNDQDIQITHDPDVGLALNGSTTIYRTGAGQYDAAFAVREGQQSDAHFEWGHSNTSGYGCTIGATNGGGTPFIGFFNGPGTNSNTFRTYDIRGNGFYAASGAIYVYDVTTATGDNQSLTNRITFDTTNGNITTAGTVTAAAGSTLLIVNSSGSTLKTVKGIS